MEMTIDEAIKIIESAKNFSYDAEYDNAFDVAIETMHKYQKIKEILKDDTYYEEYGNNAEKFIVSAICEVLEDGKID